LATTRVVMDSGILIMTHDSQYLALAERLECEFWTADERLFNAIVRDFSWIRWLGNG